MLRGTRGLSARGKALHLTLVSFLLLVLGTPSTAQLPKPKPPPPKAAPAKTDPLGRETPRGAVVGFLKYEQRDDFTTAARYLQPSSDGNAALARRAREMRALHGKFKGDIALVSDDPLGTVEAGLPPGEVRAGQVTVGNTTVDVILVRVDDPQSGKIWLISQETVARIPQLYALLESEEPTALDRLIPMALTGRHLAGMSLAQWLGWLLSIPIAWLLAWPLDFLLTVPRRAVARLQKVPFKRIWDASIGAPLRCIIAILLHSLFVYLLHPPLLYRLYYFRFMAAVLAGSVAWLVNTVADRGFARMVDRTRIQHAGGESILIVVQRLTRIVMFIAAVLCALALMGVDVRTTLAGIGVGGLAIALAAQKTLENLIAGVSLLMDKAVLAGDACLIGSWRGTVEEIGLRSLKLRTVDQSLLVVPNGALATMPFENMRSRRKLPINQTFSLRIETQADQLRLVLTRVKSMLDNLPEIESGTSRIRVSRFAGAAFELELFAYVTTGDWMAFTAIREEIVLKIAEIVESSGTQFAPPTQLAYLSGDVGALGMPIKEFDQAAHPAQVPNLA